MTKYHVRSVIAFACLQPYLMHANRQQTTCAQSEPAHLLKTGGLSNSNAAYDIKIGFLEGIPCTFED